MVAVVFRLGVVVPGAPVVVPGLFPAPVANEAIARRRLADQGEEAEENLSAAIALYQEVRLHFSEGSHGYGVALRLVSPTAAQ